MFQSTQQDRKNRLFIPKWPFYDFLIAWFQLNIHKFKCIARFGLMHIVATNLCVWIRTVVKECTKEIAQYRVNRGHGVSEDYMILGKCMHFVYYVLDKSSNKLVLYKAKTLTFHNTFFVRNTQRKYSTLQILKKRHIRRKCLTSDYVCFRKLPRCYSRSMYCHIFRYNVTTRNTFCLHFQYTSQKC